MTAAAHSPVKPRIRWLSLSVALVIMVVGTVYPPLMADATGHADHGLAMALFWAMSAGFVHGVGFVPQRGVWRALFGGWACAAALLAAVVLKLLH
jgi:cyd operon protein YbgE